MVGARRIALKGNRVLAAGFWLAFLALLSSVALSSGTSVASHTPGYEFKESFGPDGSDATSFNFAGSTAFDQQSDLVYVLDTNVGTLYKFDSEGEPVDWGGSSPYISEHRITGLTPPVQQNRSQIAVDSATHKVYVTEANSLRAFLPNGEPAEFTAGPGMGTSTIGGFSAIGGVATDVNGYIYASDGEAGVVKVFEPSGALVTEFAASNAANLAVDSNGTVYVTQLLSSVLKFVPSGPLPVTGGTTYAPDPEPVDSSTSLTVAVDPATNDVYISRALPSSVAVYDENGEFIASFGQSGSEGELSIARGLAIDGGSTKVYVGNRSGSVSRVMVFEPEPPPPPGPPAIEAIAVRDVGNTSATLRALINPNSLATSYHFEYGLEDCALSACISVPINPADIGAGHDPVLVSHDIAGLLAATTYHYRVVAENSEDSVEKSGVFRTQGSGLGFERIDRRVWEMVSPPDKQGALISPLGSEEGYIQAAADGNGFAYLTLGSIEEDPAGNRSKELSTALAGRGADGSWDSKDITPPSSRVVPLAVGQQNEYKVFDAGLSEALLEPRDGTNLSPEASERAPYWRQNSEPPVYRPLVTGKEGFANVPPDVEFGGGSLAAVSRVAIRAATPGLDHVVLSSDISLSPEVVMPPGGTSRGIYMWTDGQLEPLGVLPDAEGGGIVPGPDAESSIVGSGVISVRHAISDDGSRVFWTSSNSSQGPLHLYVRDPVADESARIDLPSDGSGVGTSKPIFQGASADGSVVFFTSGAQLTADASPSGADLYRCELPLSAPLTGCASLVNLSAPLSGSGESGEVLGMVSALSEDGTKAYFVARGKLDTEANQAGDFAVPGEPNLYLWQDGEGVRFIATLSERDSANWGFVPSVGSGGGLLSPVSSPSGRYLAFMSERSLSGEDHLDAAGEPVERVFRYDMLTERLDCVSCDPTGAGPEGVVIGTDEGQLIDPRFQWSGRLVAAAVPQSPLIGLGEASYPLYHTRAVHDNGRVFFNATDALVPADSNGTWDVYQYEPNGTGTCSSSVADAATSSTAGGCVSLISSGTADRPSGFLDASIGGDDVFFLTPARLSVLDQDDENDIYDARVDGIAARFEPPAECLGEACQPPPVVPNDPTPAGNTFQGPGNVKPKPAKRCPKGKRKVRRNGKVRCVPRKTRKSQSQKPRAGQDRRAAR